MNLREKLVLKVVDEILGTINSRKLSREEIVILLGQVLIRTGYSIHFNYEVSPEKRAQAPKNMTLAEANKLYEENFTTGTTLIKIGFDLQEVLLLKTE